MPSPITRPQTGVILKITLRLPFVRSIGQAKRLLLGCAVIMFAVSIVNFLYGNYHNSLDHIPIVPVDGMTQR